MRLPSLAVLAVGLCVLSSTSRSDAHLVRDRIAKQDSPPELSAFRGHEARDAAREHAAKQESQRLQGTWDCLAWEEAGRATAEEELKGRTAFFGADVCLFREGSKLVQILTLKLDPTRNPKTVTATVNQGRLKGEVLLGIYELQDDTFKVCFDTEGQQRPTEFSGSATGRILASYKRRPTPANEEVSLAGRYKSLSIQLDGSEHRADAVIHRRGDSYVISYMKGSAVTYVGVGIRRGNQLSVCWANRGQAGISVYRIEDGPNLIGNYTELGGVGYLSREILTFEDAGD